MNDASTATITITNLTDPDELFCHYRGEHEIQPCHLALDLEDGGLTADYNGEVGGGMPKSVYERRTLRFIIPCLTAEVANALMEDAKPLAQRIVAGAAIEWDGNNHVGRLNADAQAASEDLDRMCDAANFSEADCVVEYDAGDWFSGEGSRAVVAERLEITAATTDEQIAAMVKAEEEDARTNTSGYGHVLLTGAEEYLTEIRDELRDEVREELREVGKQVKTATVRRDELITKLHAWGDSDRTIGDLAGVSHRAVQQKTGR